MRLQHAAHLVFVSMLVRLGAVALHGGALRGVEHAELDAGGVDDLRHLAAQRIDLAHHVALADAADGGVARHEGDVVEVQREEQGGTPHPRRGQCRFTAGVPGSNHYDVIPFHENIKLLGNINFILLIF